MGKDDLLCPQTMEYEGRYYMNYTTTGGQDIWGETRQQEESSTAIYGLEEEPGLINTLRDAQHANKTRTSHM